MGGRPACLPTVRLSAPQNVYVVLDLYGRVTSVSIVSSSLLEEADGTKPPSVTSEPYSEEEEEEEEAPPVRALHPGDV